MQDLIKHQLIAGVLTLTIDRPDKLNALSNAMYTRLADLLFAAAEDPETAVVVITGGAECFTSGNDLNDFLQDPPSHLDSPAFRFMQAVLRLEKPLIAAVCGAAVGIGTTLLLHCDQVLITRNAKLRMPFVNLGLCPEFGASLLLPRLLGQTRAARLLLWGDGLDGAQALDWGLANELFDDGEQCLAAAQQLAKRLVSVPRESLIQTRRLLRQPLLKELEATIERENLLFIQQLKSVECQQALNAIVQRSASR